MAGSAKRTFIVQLGILRWAGISVLEKETIFFRIYSYTILGSILSASILGIQAIITNPHRLDTLTENLVFGGALAMAFLKTWSIYLLRTKLGKSLALLEHDWFVPSKIRGGTKEEMLMKEAMTYVTAQVDTKLGITLVVASFLYALSPNIRSARLRIIYSHNSSYWELPFGEVSLLQADDSPNYEVVWFYQYVANFMACIGYSSTNGFMAAVMAFLSAECRMLQNAIRTSVERSTLEDIERQEYGKNTVATKIKWKTLHKSLREIVQYHTLITDTINEFERLFCIPSLVDFFGLSIIICLALFYGTLVPGLNSRFMQMTSLIIGSTTAQFMTSYWGNEVTLQYSAIADACNQVDYVGTDVRFQKGLYIIMQRTQKSIHFTVGKFAPLTLGTFISVMKAAYSYCMLLHNMGITV